jgi:hypothetical protein
MTTIRCSNCSFLNFATASVCKRCKAEFAIVPAEVGTNAPAQIENLAPAGYEASVQPAYQPAPFPAAPFEAAPQWPQPGFQSPFPPPPPNYFQSPIAPLPRASKYGATNAALWLLLVLAVALIFSFGVFRVSHSHDIATSFAWQQYTAQDGSYTVLMPSRPVESVQSEPTPIGDIQAHISEVDMGQTGAFMVAYADYPSSVTNLPSQSLLDAGAQGAVAKSGASLVSKKNITLNGYPGVELELLPPAGQGLDGGHARARIYWVAPRLYIMFTGVSKSVDETTMTKFLDSFQFNNR